MFNKFIIYFFSFFLFSRFLSEKLKLFPKWVDLINFPLFAILIILLIFKAKQKSEYDNGEQSYIVKYFMLFLVFWALSVFLNRSSVLLPSAFLFILGFMEGPLLFIALNKLSIQPLKLVNNLSKLFLILLIVNFVIVTFIDIPAFLLTGNPDLISGTYGFNTYQFSVLLIICAGYLFGYNYQKKNKTYIVIITQFMILLVFYLSQFRSALPFFFTSYFLIILLLYGAQIARKFVYISIFVLIAFLTVSFLIKSDSKIEALRYDDWGEILQRPFEFLHLGKFQIYPNTVNMISEYPEAIIIGVGPGNYLSRANYTFSYELLTSRKYLSGSAGTIGIIESVFGISRPNFTKVSEKYVNYMRNISVFGTWQLSNPQTSYLAVLAEIGIFGQIAIFAMYIFMIRRSFTYFKIIMEKRPEYIALSLALIGGCTYLFMLAFLDNYWEIARVTLPVWLLFWAVKTAAYSEPL